MPGPAPARQGHGIALPASGVHTVGRVTRWDCDGYAGVMRVTNWDCGTYGPLPPVAGFWPSLCQGPASQPALDPYPNSGLAAGHWRADLLRQGAVNLLLGRQTAVARVVWRRAGRATATVLISVASLTGAVYGLNSDRASVNDK